MTKAELEKEFATAQRKIDQLRAELHGLQNKRDEISLKLYQLKFSCSCVRINKEIGIFNGQQQHQANRRGLGLGLVSETLSSSLSCPICKGTGVPNETDRT